MCHRGFISDPAQWTVTPRQTGGDIGGVVPVVLAPLAAPAGQGGGVGNVPAGHSGAEPVDEPSQNPTASTATRVRVDL